MATGDVTVIATRRFVATIYVERETSANKWTLALDGAAPKNMGSPPSPFVWEIEGLEFGEHTIEVVQQSGNTEVARGMTTAQLVPEPMRPTVAEVASLIRARTKDSEGREVGTFTEETRPTYDQVQAHITAAVGLLAPRFPVEVSDDLHPAIRTLTAYRAAMQIEKSYFPEQVRSDRSAYDQLREEYQDDLAALMDSLGAGDGNGGGSARGASAGSEWTPTFLAASQDFDDYWPEPENPANWTASPFQAPREPPLPEDLPVGDEPASGQWLR